MSERSYLIRIEYKDRDEAFVRYNTFEKLNELSDEDAVAALINQLRHILSQDDKKKISEIFNLELEVSIDNNVVTIELDSFDLEAEILADRIVKYVYDKSVSLLYKMDFKFGSMDYFISQYHNGKYKDVYYTGSGSLYVENFNHVFDDQSYDEALDTIIQLHKQGKIIDRYNIDKLVDMCKDQNIDLKLWEDIQIKELKNINFHSSSGDLILNAALRNIEYKILVKMLFNWGNYQANPHLRDAMGKNAYDVANECGLQDAVLMMTPYDDRKFSVLMDSAKDGEMKFAEIYLKSGEDPNEHRSGYTALMLASKNGHNEMIKLLLEAGAKVNILNDAGWSSLMFAANAGNAESVKLLVENDADLDIEDMYGWTALKLACERNHTEILELLQK